METLCFLIRQYHRSHENCAWYPSLLLPFSFFSFPPSPLDLFFHLNMADQNVYKQQENYFLQSSMIQLINIHFNKTMSIKVVQFCFNGSNMKNVCDQFNSRMSKQQLKEQLEQGFNFYGINLSFQALSMSMAKYKFLFESALKSTAK